MRLSPVIQLLVAGIFWIGSAGADPGPAASGSAQDLMHNSASFLGRPYLLHPLGEGELGQVDRQVRYRQDGFDCQTYVDTVLAVTLAGEDGDWHKTLDLIRYGGLPPSYAHRLHFVSVDWNPWLHDLGLLSDVTPEVSDKAELRGRLMQAVITPKLWFEETQCTGHAGHPANGHTVRAGEGECRGKGMLVETWPEEKLASIYVLPITELLDKENHLKPSFAAQLPPVSVVEWVTLDPDSWRNKIGTPLLVTHMGFLFKQGDHVWLRHASSVDKKVEDVPLEDYLNVRIQDNIALHLEKYEQQE